MDQASGLRRMLSRPAVRVLPVIGHEGSQWVASMLARALVNLGERVLLIDQADRSCARLLGAEVTHSLEELVAGQCDYADAVIAADSGVQVAFIRGELTRLGNRSMTAEQILGAFVHAPEPADLLVIHYSHPAAIARTLSGEGEILLTTGADPASIRSTYLNIKRTCARPHRYRLVVVGRADESRAALVHSKIAGTARRFLGIAPDFEGAVPAPSACLPHDIPPDTAGVFKHLASRALSWRFAEFSAFSRERGLLAVPH